MPVKTPELEEPVYATQQSAAAETPAMPTGSQPTPLPAGAGFVSKAGAGAYVANSLIDGWLKGRQVAAQRNMQKAQNELGTWKNIYDDQRDRYKAAVMQTGEQSPEAVQAKQDAVAAWNHYNQTRLQYAIPDQSKGKDGKGKKQGGGFSGAMGNLFGKSGVTPHMIPEMAIKATMNNPVGLNLNPDDLERMEKYKQAKASTELSNLQIPLTQSQIKEQELKTQVETQKVADDNRMKAIVSKPEKDRTAEDNQWLDGWQKIQHISDPESAKVADSVLKKIMSGAPLSETERNFAYTQKLLQGPQSIQFNDGLTTYLGMVSPDGQMLSKVKLGRVFHEDEAAVAARSQMLMHDLKVKEFVRGGMSQKDAEQSALLEEARNPAMVAQFIGNNPIAQELRTKAVSDALKTVFNNAGGMNADPETRKAAQAVMTNFISGDPKGAKSYLMFRNQVADPTGKTGMLWWKQPAYAGGIKQEQLGAAQAALWNEVRTTMQQQNPNMTPMDLDQAMPEWLKSPEGKPPEGAKSAAGMTAPPAASGQQMTAPPTTGEIAKTVGKEALDSLGPIGSAERFVIPAAANLASSLMSTPPRDMTKTGKNGAYGEATKNTKIYRIRTSDHGWVKMNLEPSEAEERKQAGQEITETDSKE